MFLNEKRNSVLLYAYFTLEWFKKYTHSTVQM